MGRTVTFSEELKLLRELAEAVLDMARFDDLGDPLLCEACRPEDPEAFTEARQRVHALLAEWQEVAPCPAP